MCLQKGKIKIREIPIISEIRSSLCPLLHRRCPTSPVASQPRASSIYALPSLGLGYVYKSGDPGG